MKVTLNTGSTIVQGLIIKGGNKMSPEYKNECGTCNLNPEDFEELGNPEKVKVKTEVGSVTVFAVIDPGMRRGEIFIPRGPWANTIVSENTFNTGSAYYKGMDASVESSDDDIPECDELIREYYMK
ncbi:MAG: formylmethanofuran dehydrogenase [Candidatus Altiarchaeales archaeon HGW-Altiarchaeales-3]|nr:MAG: formylmethanofuran dehydrogenase [Candidatus Altiarchaeales archaeon HGW-Altiarchaeales-3]